MIDLPHTVLGNSYFNHYRGSNRHQSSLLQAASSCSGTWDGGGWQCEIGRDGHAAVHHFY